MRIAKRNCIKKSILFLCKQMKRKLILFLTGILIVNLLATGQNFIKFHTKELVEISEKFGFDSVFSIIGNFSIYELDPEAAFAIAQNSQKHPSKFIGNYLIKYALRNNNDTLIFPFLLNYFENELKKIHEYEPNYTNSFPVINIDLIHVLLNFPPEISEKLLIRYFNEWEKKSQDYRANFIKAKDLSDKNKYNLIQPYQSCSFNCYLILLGLQKLNSDFSDTNKLNFHRNNLCVARQNIVSLRDPSNLLNYKTTEVIKTLKLSKQYKSIDEIDFNKETEIKKEFKIFAESYLTTNNSKTINRLCLKKLIYFESSGYLQFSCTLGVLSGLGILYRIELIDNTLVLYLISSYLS